MHKEDFLLGSGLMQSDLYPCGGPEKQSIWPYVPNIQSRILVIPLKDYCDI